MQILGRGLSIVFLIVMLVWAVEAGVFREDQEEEEDTGDGRERMAEQVRDQAEEPAIDGPAPQCTGYDRHTFSDAGLDDLDLEAATQVAAGAGGGLWILASDAVLQVKDSQVDVAHDLPGAGNRLAAGPGGEVAVSTGHTVSVFGPGETGSRTIDLSLPDDVVVGGLGVADGGTVLVGDTGEGRITAHEPGGAVRVVLGIAGDDEDAEVQLDEPLGPIYSLVALPRDRIAVLWWSDIISLVDDGDVRHVPLNPQDPSRGIAALAPAPGGGLLALAIGSETHPQVWVIDIETGQADALADLQWNETGYLDVAAVGEDLVYLADNHLCRLTGVLG